MIRLFRHIIILGLALISGSCGGKHETHRDAIAVSFEPQAWMARQIAGDDLDIITLLPAGSDPEVYQPSISTMKGLADANVYLSLGTPGFEESIANNISRNFPDLKIIDCAEGIDKIYDSHATEGDIRNNEESFDPHLLASIRNSILIADNIAKTLSEIYPEKSTKYREAGKALKERLTALDDSIKRMNISGKPFVIRHPSLSYYARDYGANQIALSDVGKETSPIQLKRRIDASSESAPAVMVVEKEHASPSDFDTARQLGVDTIRVSLNTSSWINDIMRISHEIDRD